MLSKAQISLLTSLQHKKFRKVHGLFVVEGLKSVTEFLSSSYDVQALYHTADLDTKVVKISRNIKSHELNNTEFAKISQLQSPQGILAVVRLPKDERIQEVDFRNQFTLLLDDIQDPGNLGTIIRTAEWFGFRHIVCSKATVDAYNPKVVQATMGSLARIQVHYTDLSDLIDKIAIPVFGALLKGVSIYETEWGKEGFILMGNEGNGICDSLIAQVQLPVSIPRIGKAESLNVAVAATIFCNEIARRGS